MSKKEMTPREKKCVIFLSFLTTWIAWSYFTYKPFRYDFKPQPPARDLTIKVPIEYTNGSYLNSLNSSYLNSLDSTNPSSATSVETSKGDSKPPEPPR